MTMKLRLGGAWKDITSGKVFAGGSWRALVAVQIYADGDWRKVANFTSSGGAITVTISPDTSAASGRGASVTTGNYTATPMGGLAPYTYAWTQVSATQTVTITAPTSAVTKFSMTMTATDGSATFRCAVTDALGATISDTCTASFHQLDPIII